MKKGKLTCLGLVIVFTLTWGIYLKTLCPTVFVGDSGELVTAGYYLGIPHPPGYPLYVLLGSLFSNIPLGEIAYRFNLLSAFLTTTGTALLFIYLFNLFNNLIISSSLALCGAFGTVTWEMAASTEVYPVVSVLLIALLLVLYMANTTKKPGYLYCGALICGLGLSSHYSFIFFLPGVLIYLYRGLTKLTTRIWIVLISLGLLGWLTFICLPMRAKMQPPINWGNTQNISNMVNHLTRFEYQEVASPHTLQQYFRQLHYMLLYIKAELPLFLGFFSFFGLLVLFAKQREEFYLLLLIGIVIIAGGTYFLNYAVLSRALGFGPKFFIPLFLILLIMLGALIKWIISFTGRNTRYVYLLVLLLPAICFLSHYDKSNLRQHRVARNFADDLLITPTASSTLLIDEEINELFTVCYVKNVLGKRADLKVFGPHSNTFTLSYAPYFDMGKRQSPSRRYRTQVEKWALTKKDFQPLFYTINPYSEMTSAVTGLLNYPVKMPPPTLTRNIWKYYHYKKDLSGIPLNYYSRIVVFTYPYRLGAQLLEEKRFAAGKQVLFTAYQLVKGIPRLAYNLGVICQENGLYEKALAFFADELALGTPNHSAWINTGVIYEKLNKWPQALSAYENALAIEEDPLLMSSVAYVYFQLGNHERASDLFARAAKLKPDSDDIAFKRALNMMKFNKTQAALLWQNYISDYQDKADPAILRKAQQNLLETSK